MRGHAACALTGCQGGGVVFFPAEKISTPVRWAPVGRPRPPLTALVHGLSLSCRRTQPASAVGPSPLQYSPWTRTGGKRLWIMTFALLGGGLARPPSPPASLKTQPGPLPCHQVKYPSPMSRAAVKRCSACAQLRTPLVIHAPVGEGYKTLPGLSRCT